MTKPDAIRLETRSRLTWTCKFWLEGNWSSPRAKTEVEEMMALF